MVVSSIPLIRSLQLTMEKMAQMMLEIAVVCSEGPETPCGPESLVFSSWALK